MTRLILKWALNSFALFLVMKLIPGIQIDRFQDLLAGALVIGLLNTFLRPIIPLLTLPVTVLTLGLFTLVINGLMFFLAAHLVTGFHVPAFLPLSWQHCFSACSASFSTCSFEPTRVKRKLLTLPARYSP